MTFRFTVDEYYELREKYLDKEISSDLWSLYCLMYLQKLMEKHSDILKKLK
jgi:hypothetical protein